MKKATLFLPLLLLILVGCNMNKYEQYFENPNDWVVYYSYHSPIDAKVAVENEPVAVMTLNRSLSTYSFHDIDQKIFRGGAYMPFSNEGTHGTFSDTLTTLDLAKLSEIDCQYLRGLEENSVIGEFAIKRDEPANAEIGESEVFGMTYQIRVKQIANSQIELQLKPYMPGMIQFASWTINKRFCQDKH